MHVESSLLVGKVISVDGTNNADVFFLKNASLDTEIFFLKSTTGVFAKQYNNNI